MLEPVPAPVRPRVVSPVTGDSLLLEDLVLLHFERGRPGVIWICGGPGSGKTTALAHLAAVLPPATGVTLRDTREVPTAELSQGLVIAFCESQIARSNALAVYELAPWGQDELIEYLLKVWPDRCHSVMRCCGTVDDQEFLRGIPELWRPVLDVLAGDENVPTIREALRRVLDEFLSKTNLRDPVSRWCLARLIPMSDASERGGAAAGPAVDDPSIARLLRHRPLQLLAAARHIARELASEGQGISLATPLPRDLVAEAADLISSNKQALRHLEALLTRPQRQVLHPMAASLKLAAEPEWRPRVSRVRGARKGLRRERVVIPNLAGAYLAGAQWSKLDLAGIHLADADLHGADLTEATLDDAQATHADLSGARLNGARLLRLDGVTISLKNADLSYIRATGALLLSADASGTNFEGAMLGRATFVNANLCGATFKRANLAFANLFGAKMEAASFVQTEFQGASLGGVALRLAEFRHCSFQQANLADCDFEGMRSLGTNFRQANLTRALLTGTLIPGADFRGAILVNAGLAEIDWERANLQGSDLRGASFHLGSSRSGLVDSPIACYGSRTGFYTDDYCEQDFKPPEEIRKANLRGADLRGARIDGVDFYLVDLRDARYDARQEEQFRGCGAILESRV
ncbi:MAG: pentapeptide repeat-containing protein [Planctomycetaceae bacterium]